MFSMTMQGAFEETFDGGGPSVARCLRQTRSCTFQLHGHEQRSRHAFEGQTATEGPKCHGTHGINVSAFVSACSPSNLFGRHIRKRSERCIERSQRRFCLFTIPTTQLGDSKIEYL